MTAPADRPAAARLTDADLAALETAWRPIADEVARQGPYANIGLMQMQNLLRGQERLIAEVRRQRRVLADLANFDAEVFRLMGHEAELPQEEP